jgi:pantoate--beta-alanine ligase
MKITTLRSETTAKIYAWKEAGLTVGFVPTMGALHRGHISLIEEARKSCDIVTCSIFVNPIQFNNSSDLETYPKTIEADIEKLENAGCDLVFIPDTEEMYPEPVSEKYDFGALENVLEGAFRPGHFNGVAVVVKRLFDIMIPDRAFFGEKDYQQLLIIKALVRHDDIPVKIVPCPIIRENDGLAMSSRNARLSEKERAVAPFIYNTLCKAVEMGKTKTVDEIISWGEAQFNGNDNFKLEYFQIADNIELQPVVNKKKSDNARLLVAAWLGNVRLIDNVNINF